MLLHMQSLLAPPIAAEGIDAAAAAAAAEARRHYMETVATVMLTAAAIAIVSLFGVAIELI